MRHVQIAARFCGPPSSGNGGYTAGLLAEASSAPVEVTLRAPPPLDSELALEPAAGGGARMLHGSTLIAEAAPVDFELELPEAVSWADAEQAEPRFIGFHDHPYPTCFVCGTARAAGDGLRIFTGPVEGRPLVAARWKPQRDLCDGHGRLEARFAWSALDCPAWFGYASFDPNAPKILLGRMAAKIERAPEADEPCVIVGWSTGREGRRIACASALFDANGTCLAQARSTWVVLKA